MSERALRKVALFDMDRTLVRRETASLYVRYQRDTGNATLRDSLRVAWWVAQYTAGIVNAERVAEQAIIEMRGLPETVMSARCDDWVRRYVAQHISDQARRTVDAYRSAGAFMAIVTGASPYAARPVARLLGIPHVVATEFEVDAHHFTGRPALPLCFGEGKVVRAQRLAEEHGFQLSEAVFYSDSYTDLPLLLACGEPVIVNPDPRLRREAARRGWRVERW